jgi:hypothetical protein
MLRVDRARETSRRRARRVATLCAPGWRFELVTWANAVTSVQGARRRGRKFDMNKRLSTKIRAGTKFSTHRSY